MKKFNISNVKYKDGIYSIDRPLCFDYEDEFSGWTEICIPENYSTDLKSIPKVFQKMVSPECIRCWLLYDYLSSTPDCSRRNGYKYYHSEALEILDLSMKAMGVPFWKVWIIHGYLKYSHTRWDSCHEK